MNVIVIVFYPCQNKNQSPSRIARLRLCCFMCLFTETELTKESHIDERKRYVYD
jgi:hypothetical protein